MPNLDKYWSKSFSHAIRTETGQVIAYFEDGTTSPPGSIVIGCDGAHSQVRKFLKGDAAARKQLPIWCLGATVVFPTSVGKAMRDLDPYFMQIGDKTQDVFEYFAFLDGPGNNDGPNRETRTCQIFMSRPPRPEKGLREVPETASKRLALMKKRSSEWSEPFRGIIAAMPEDTKPTTLRLEDWAAPIAWDNLEGTLTLAGNGAHPMTM
jgi:2-polyprenyl-6-methoxyphenol hydroxylase-like FAD-dependent oxidoreductase